MSESTSSQSFRPVMRDVPSASEAMSRARSKSLLLAGMVTSPHSFAGHTALMFYQLKAFSVVAAPRHQG